MYKNISIVGIICASVVLATLGFKGLDVLEARYELKHRVDTVLFSRTDTLISVDTIISRAPDTVRVIINKTGPLTQHMLAQLICGDLSKGENLAGTEKDKFAVNGYGMLFCPEDPTENKKK